MNRSHPFTWISTSSQKTVFFVTALLAIGLLITLQALNAPLRTDAAPSGIISYELAGDVATANEILESGGKGLCGDQPGAGLSLTIHVCDRHWTCMRIVGRSSVNTCRFPQKWEIAQVTNGEGRTGGIREALQGADAVVALSRPGPGVIGTEDIAVMAANPIVFACANPIPEIWPWEAADAGAGVVATGRSDFPNQVNNSLGFPGIFRGVLDVRSTRITDIMCITAAEELALIAEEKGLHAEAILPTMEDWEIFPRVATAVGMKAQELGLAQRVVSKEDLYRAAHDRIERARAIVETSMERGFIQEPPPAETVIYAG
jgi:malic enzyme